MKFLNPDKILERKLRKISLTGRLCYIFMCVEKYLITLYPQKNWTPVAKRCWQWTKDYWDKGWDIYSAVVPEFLFEFDNYEQTKVNFDGNLSEKDYYELIDLFKGITNGNSNDEINKVLMLPIDFSNNCECRNFGDASYHSMYVFHDIQHIFSLHNIDLPDINKVADMKMSQKNGWGDFIDSEYLSIILN